LEETEMSKKRRVYSAEFKREAIQLAERSDRSDGQIEAELGITPGLLSKWKRKQNREGTEGFRGHGQRTAAEEELTQLRRENERLRQEREILKKAVAIFTQSQR
jgi:transposase